MDEPRANYEAMSKEDLIRIIGNQHQELIIAEAIKNEYKKHLEEAIEYHSVEKYRAVVKKNREAAATASH